MFWLGSKGILPKQNVPILPEGISETQAPLEAQESCGTVPGVILMVF